MGERIRRKGGRRISLASIDARAWRERGGYVYNRYG